MNFDEAADQRTGLPCRSGSCVATPDILLASQKGLHTMTLTISSCQILVSPGDVDAGAEMTLTGKVVCSPVHDLSGQSLRITDHTGALVATTPFTEFDDEVNTTSGITVKAPDAPGTYTWFAVPLEEQDGTESCDAGQTRESVPFSFTVTAHATRLVAWDVPSAIEAGQTFAMKIGVKCSSNCDMAGRSFEVLDHTGERVAAGELTGELWPGSDGLYFAELQLTAPRTEDLYEWQVQLPQQEAAYPHQAASNAFRVRAVAPADFTVRIEAIDSKKEEPLSNVSVVMHPYRAMTDDKGMAEVRVARGAYTVFVSRRGYYPLQRDMEVTENVTTRAPLTAEPPPSKDW